MQICPYKSNIDSPGRERGPPWWESGVQPPEILHNVGRYRGHYTIMLGGNEVLSKKHAD